MHLGIAAYLELRVVALERDARRQLVLVVGIRVSRSANAEDRRLDDAVRDDDRRILAGETESVAVDATLVYLAAVAYEKRGIVAFHHELPARGERRTVEHGERCVMPDMVAAACQRNAVEGDVRVVVLPVVKS